MKAWVRMVAYAVFMTAFSSTAAVSDLDATHNAERAQLPRQRYEFHIIDPGDTGSAIYRRFCDDGECRPQEADTAGVRVFPTTDYPDPATTVYDVVPRGRARSKLLDAVRHNMLRRANIDMDGVADGLSGLGLLGRILQPSIDVLVHFADGSHVALALGNTTALVFELEETSARDSHGNAVPVLREQIATRKWTFDFRGPGNPRDARYLRDQLCFLGVDIDRVPPDAAGYTCGATSGTHALSCAAL